jgi:hypothetical protein
MRPPSEPCQDLRSGTCDVTPLSGGLLSGKPSFRNVVAAGEAKLDKNAGLAIPRHTVMHGAIDDSVGGRCGGR